MSITNSATCKSTVEQAEETLHQPSASADLSSSFSRSILGVLRFLDFFPFHPVKLE